MHLILNLISSASSTQQAMAVGGIDLLETKAGAAILGALVGGSIAIAGGLGSQLFIRWRERSLRRKMMMAALTAEVHGLVLVLEEAFTYRDRLKGVTGSYWYIPWSTLKDVHIRVYLGSSTDIALLPCRIVSPLVSFYGKVSSLQEFITSVYNVGKDIDPEFKRAYLHESNRRYEEVIKEGQELLEILKQSR